MSARPSKYGNRFTEIDGIKFRSAREAKRYTELKLLQRQGEIADLKLQPRFPLTVNGVKIFTYVADFQYRDVGLDQVVVEDVKGARTLLYIAKSRLFQALHGFPVREV